MYNLNLSTNLDDKIIIIFFFSCTGMTQRLVSCDQPRKRTGSLWRTAEKEKVSRPSPTFLIDYANILIVRTRHVLYRA